MAQQRNHTRLAPPTTLDGLFAGFQQRSATIRSFNGPIIPEMEDEPVRGDIFDQLRQQDKLYLLTNFEDAKLHNLAQALIPHVAAASRRGPRPKSTTVDSLLCYLTWCKSAAEFAILAKLLGLKESRLEDNVTRMRSILNALLKKRWWENQDRPTVRHHSQFPHVALLIDHHTTQCFRPKTRFSEAKIYWDGKNKIYGIKSAVAVRAVPPHYCEFALPHAVGSVHDYQDLKRRYALMLEYLQKRPDEAAV